MPHCNDNPTELNFEVGDVVAVDESRDGAWIWGVNVRSSEKGSMRSRPRIVATITVLTAVLLVIMMVQVGSPQLT